MFIFSSAVVMSPAEHVIRRRCGVCSLAGTLLSAPSDKDLRSYHNAIAHCGSVMDFPAGDIRCAAVITQCEATQTQPATQDPHNLHAGGCRQGVVPDGGDTEKELPVGIYRPTSLKRNISFWYKGVLAAQLAGPVLPNDHLLVAAVDRNVTSRPGGKTELEAIERATKLLTQALPSPDPSRLPPFRITPGISSWQRWFLSRAYSSSPRAPPTGCLSGWACCFAS